jgi:hypothetical protein
MRKLFLAAIACLACGLAGPITPSPTQAFQIDGQSSLKDLLEKGLRARRPEEFQFIARVVRKVDEGGLPKEVVQSTFLWARRKPTYPFQYFEQALKLRAAELGVKL